MVPSMNTSFQSLLVILYSEWFTVLQSQTASVHSRICLTKLQYVYISRFLFFYFYFSSVLFHRNYHWYTVTNSVWGGLQCVQEGLMVMSVFEALTVTPISAYNVDKSVNGTLQMSSHIFLLIASHPIGLGSRGITSMVL